MNKRRIHYFNPGHETAILSGKPNYTPTKNVQIMQSDLAILPLWYARTEDVIWVDDYSRVESYYNYLQSLFHVLPEPIATDHILKDFREKEFEAAPWGISPQSLHHFAQVKKRYNLNINIQEWDNKFKDLTGRQTALQVLNQLKELYPDSVYPESPVFCKSMQEIQSYMQKHNPPFILKTPFSSSGRGLLWLNSKDINSKDQQWIEGALNKQEEVSIEPALNKKLDFAMEFESNGKGSVSYQGLSIFGTFDKGAYSGNILGSDSYREEVLFKSVSKEDFDQIKRGLENVLSHIYGDSYKGCIGVDMILYKPANTEHILIHPCIEINMRQTMGMLALDISHRYIAPESTGHFLVQFENKPGKILKKDAEMKQSNPLIMENNRIKSGYLSLCPIYANTRYWAYINVSCQKE